MAARIRAIAACGLGNSDQVSHHRPAGFLRSFAGASYRDGLGNGEHGAGGGEGLRIEGKLKLHGVSRYTAKT